MPTGMEETDDKMPETSCMLRQLTLQIGEKYMLDFD